MKRLWIALMTLLLVLGLCGCSKEYIFPENATVLGVDVQGCNKEEAWAKLEAATGSYVLELAIDEATVSLSAAELGLTCSKDAFLAAADAMAAGTPADFSGIITFDETKLKEIIRQNFNKDVVETAIVFDEAAGAYQLTPHEEGLKTNPEAVAAALRDAICALTPQQTLKDVSEVLLPVHSADDPQLQTVLEQLNKMTGIELTYDFQSGSGNNSVAAHRIPAEKLRSFVDLGEDGFTPTINTETIDAYVAELAEEYNVEGKTGSFKTTGGSTLNMTVSYEGRLVDNTALSQDIVTCMIEGISENRPVPYQSGGVMDMPYGGTYIEVNLTAQHLWFYKNGECLVSTDLVSGMVGAGMNTPTGIYSIYAKATNTYLVGEDYRSYVNYWMPFTGGYGLHDATWRSSFGGSIYLYDGSHGCVNLPLSAAKTLYNNSTVGTKVILYGGVGYVPPLDQKLTGTTSYDVADDTKPFALNIKAAYADPDFTYSSSNPAVATVSEDGTVTVKGIGTATITVNAEKDSCYAEATIAVTVNVHSACDEGRHSLGQAEVTTAPTCQPGVEKAACSKCDHTAETELAPVQPHSFGDWVTTKEATCGADGVKERTCTVCSAVKETAAIPATGNHTPGDWQVVTNASCAAEGKQVKKCAGCGAELESAAIPKTEHSFGNGPVCTGCGAANPNYIAPAPEETAEE